MKVLVFAIAGTSAVIFLYYLLAIHLGLPGLLARRGGDLAGRASWTDRGPTPLGEEGYTPQGMTWVDGAILFANTWKDTRSRVYEIDPESMSIRRHFDMPEEAVHTSGLAWDGGHLWAVDYISNRAYCIDLEPSLAAGRIRLVGSFATTLRGTSACCIVPWDDGRCLAVSDYMRTRRTLFIRTDDALRAGTAAGAIAFSYRNEGFSQGLEFIDGFLHESENKRGVDVINKLDMARLRGARDARKATVRQYPAPSAGVEDLAWDGESLWTSDESVFRFFRGTLDD